MLGCAAVLAGKRTRLIGLVSSLAVAGALVAAPGASAKAKGFELGVSSGDVTSSSAILWAKAKKSGEVEVQLTDRGGFGKLRPRGRRPDGEGEELERQHGPEEGQEARARHRLQVPLLHGRRRARATPASSPPRPSSKSKQTIRFALSGDQDARPQPGRDDPVLEQLRGLERDPRSRRTTSTCCWATRSTPTPRCPGTASPTSR